MIKDLKSDADEERDDEAEDTDQATDTQKKKTWNKLLIPSSSCCLPYIEGVWLVHCIHRIGSQLMIIMTVCLYN